VTAQLGKPAQTMTAGQLQDLLKIKASLGIPDPRHGLKECELCDNAEWRPGVACALPAKDTPAVGLDPDAEAMVKVITDQLLAQMR
jgi:L-fuculose-phosphate aldolase